MRFRKILVANRGEIAIRIMRACHELGIRSVAIYSEADRYALHAKYADESYFIGPSRPQESYLNIRKIIAVAQESQADAIHPGYGFLAENPSFAYACEQAGIVFIGPSSRTIELMGNKVAARQLMERAGVPVVPGTREALRDPEEAEAEASRLGYPVLLKAAAGGGGIGISVVRSPEELREAIRNTQALARSTFGDDSLYLEKYLERPRHIEVQILADAYGKVLFLGERECSIQRRHQKLIEEAPSPVVDQRTREYLGELAVRAAKAANYRNAGTVEFIYEDGKFYFLEMNTRLQVEHPITEMVTGIDLVKEQIRIAAGQPLALDQQDISINGWAIECRINAEDPLNHFLPSPGTLRGYRSPGGIGVRVDSGVHTGYTIPPHYDPMISKLVAHGRDRSEALARMRRALYEYIILGVPTNIPFHKAVLSHPAFQEGRFSTRFVDEEWATYLYPEMKRIVQEEKNLAEKLGSVFRQGKKVAAASLALKHYLDKRLG
jgi:pyruvate carboxylase subunit A